MCFITLLVPPILQWGIHKCFQRTNAFFKNQEAFEQAALSEANLRVQGSYFQNVLRIQTIQTETAPIRKRESGVLSVTPWAVGVLASEPLWNANFFCKVAVDTYFRDDVIMWKCHTLWPRILAGGRNVTCKPPHDWRRAQTLACQRWLTSGTLHYVTDFHSSGTGKLLAEARYQKGKFHSRWWWWKS